MVECPHCFLKILPTSNGLCPNCQQDTHVIGQSASFTTMMVSSATRFPPYCCRCNAPTQRMEKLVEWETELVVEEGRGPGILEFLVFGLMFVLLPIAFMFGRRGRLSREWNKTEVRVPLCEACRETPVRIVTAKKGKLRIVVHRDFKRRLDAGSCAEASAR